MSEIVERVEDNILSEQPSLRNFLEKCRLKVDYIDYTKLVNEQKSGFSMISTMIAENLETSTKLWRKGEDEWLRLNKNAPPGIAENEFYKLIENYYRPAIKNFFKAFASEHIGFRGQSDLINTAVAIIRDFERIKVETAQLGLVKEIGDARSNDLKEILLKNMEIKKEENIYSIQNENTKYMQQMSQIITSQNEKINNLSKMLESVVNSQNNKQKTLKGSDEDKIYEPLGSKIEVYNATPEYEDKNERQKTAEISEDIENAIISAITESPKKGIKKYIEMLVEEGYEKKEIKEKIKAMIDSGEISTINVFGGPGKALYIKKDE